MFSSTLFLVFPLLLNLFGMPAAALPVDGDRIYVKHDAVGSQDGSSWTNAYTDLQDALAAAQSQDTIWVARGTYLPTSGNDRTATFQLVSGVAIYGGFSGNETQILDRDVQAYPTILSGDIGIPGDSTDNVFHVLTGNNLPDRVTLDGLTITGGFSADQEGDAFGAGLGGAIAVNNASLRIVNCLFENNSAIIGGAIGLNNGSNSLEIIDCEFSNNFASRRGGAIAFKSNATPPATVAGTNFFGNQADEIGGGALYAADSPEVHFIDCNFYQNSGDGGVCQANVNLTFENCFFEANSSVFRSYTVQPIKNEFKACQFINHNGAPLFRANNYQPSFNSCFFKNNSSIIYLGNSGGYAKFHNSIFTQNTGTHFRLSSSQIEVINCSFWRFGGDIFSGMAHGASPLVINSIFSEPLNVGGLILDGPASPFYGTVNFYNCLLNTDLCGITLGGGTVNCQDVLIGENPFFKDPLMDDFSLNFCSPAINIGREDSITLSLMYDFSGQARILDGAIDIGAIEFNLDSVSHDEVLCSDWVKSELQNFACSSCPYGPTDTLFHQVFVAELNGIGGYLIQTNGFNFMHKRYFDCGGNLLYSCFEDNDDVCDNWNDSIQTAELLWDCTQPLPECITTEPTCDLVVTDTCYDCPGSLKQAIECANTHVGADTITFNLTGPPPYIFQFEPGLTIQDDCTVIDATTQPGWELGMIKFDGSPFNYCTVDSSGGTFNIVVCEFNQQEGRAFSVYGNYCEIYGIEFSGYQYYALVLSGKRTVIGAPGKGNIFAASDQPSATLGKAVLNAGSFSKFQGNTFYAWLESRAAQEVIIGGDRTLGEGNYFQGPDLTFGPALLGGTSGPSVLTDSSRIAGNTLQGCGIMIGNFSPSGAVLQNFRIGGPGGRANHFEDHEYAIQAKYDSTGRMIELLPDQNTYLCIERMLDYPNGSTLPVAVTVDSAYTNAVYGTAGPSDSIQLYLAVDTLCNGPAPCMGNVFVGKTQADVNGYWKYQPENPLTLPEGVQVSALATDTSGNTSSFSPCRTVQCPEILQEIDTTLCFGETLEIQGQLYDAPGYYEDTLLFYGTCPGLVKVDLQFLPEKTSVIDTVLCAGESLEINGVFYDSTVTALPVVIPGVGPLGCDSTVYATIQVLPEKVHYLDTVLCRGDTLMVNGQPYSEPVTGAMEVIPNVGPYGCDSTILINLAVIEPPVLFETDTITITTADTLLLSSVGDYVSYLWQDGSTENALPLIGAFYDPGIYELSLTVEDTAGCLWSETALLVVEEAVSTVEAPATGAPVFYPNPTTGLLRIHLPSTLPALDLSLLTPRGRLLRQTRLRGPDATLDLGALPAGVYWLRWYGAGTSGVVRLVKM